MGNKKSQVTVFIIVGILLLFSIAVVIYIKGQVSTSETEIPRITEEVPTMTLPVKNYVDNCLRDVGKNAIKQIGLHGGYIDPSINGFNYTQLNFNVDYSGMFPTDYEVFKYNSDTEWYIPYWYHMSSKNDLSEGIKFSLAIPLIRKNTPPVRGVNKGIGENSIEAQIDRYVKNNLGDCLADFRTFKEIGYDIKEDELEVITQIGKSVIIYLNYPLEITKDESKATISQFRADFDVNLEEIYDFSYNFINGLKKYQSFDQFLRNTISAHGRLNGPIPPSADVELSLTPRYWVESVIKQEVEKMLEANVNKIKVSGTRDFLHYENIISQEDRIRWGLHRTYVMNINRSYPNLEVNFRYSKDWPIYLDIVPGEIVSAFQSGVGEGIMSFFGINRYSNPYDVSAPILVQITDPHAFDDEGFDFMFGVEANIRDNQVFSEDYKPLMMMELSPDETGEAHLCDFNQRNSGDITIETVDPLGNPYPGVSVTFESGQRCQIGQTKMQDGKAVLVSKFPVAMGNLVFTGRDSHPVKVVFATQPQRDDELKVEIPRIANKEITIKKYTIDKDPSLDRGQIRNLKTDAKDQWFLTYSLKDMLPQETVIINFDKIKEDDFEKEYHSVGLFKGNAISEVKLIPGRYNLKVTALLMDVSVSIPDCKDCICVEYYALTDNCKKHDDIDGLDFNGTFFEGSYEINNVTFEKEDLYGDNNILMRIVTFNMVDTPESNRMLKDLKMMEYMKDIVQDYKVKEKLKPKFITG